ncbi:MAG: hypothetical protein KDJ55_00260 [Rhodobiaceae bacterium]|nr:hypothetical protein [Rhodobiaceae bacterium]MCC0017800.1 hypothetical protein [Rhodobiaceae bacterium]MCC0052366.1 hypothetical protein [Rhodobiaceae bacterium]MCC0061909.1 hypothetical protein [Rhodobiaceae bacterium]
MYPGQLVVTGFPGTYIPGEEVPPGPEIIDETLIDPERPAVRILDVSFPEDPPSGQQIDAPTHFSVPVSQTGLVFGTALDDLKYPNIYVTATSAFGLHIVLPDADGDGRPERLMNGAPGASFMEGQWGSADPAGGPGSVWKIDGRTGEVSLFANIALDGFANTGAGLGNIVFYSRRGMFYVSDRDTGMIHRLDRNGNDLGTFDHGVAGRSAAGMSAQAFDPANRLDIQDGAFNVNDSSTWAMPDPRRRVWGLAVHGDRLYYAVAAGPQIWSVGINADGSFAGDPRWELDVPPAPKPFEISDIVFDPQGRMILAQRGTETGGYDYKIFASEGEARVLRFVLENPDDPATPSRWVEEPDEYAIGFRGELRNANGGVTINYDYTKDNYLNTGACGGYLWSTGEQLRNPEEPTMQDVLRPGGALEINGLQGNALPLVRPLNVPPFGAYFADFDGETGDPDTFGHMGDVEAFRVCEGPFRPPVDYGGDPVPRDRACLTIERRWSCEVGPDGRYYKLHVRNRSSLPLDTVQTTTPTPGFSVVPRRQPLGDGHFSVEVDGPLGNWFEMDVCLYRGADAATGGTFPCCKATVVDVYPEFLCEGPDGGILDDEELDALWLGE